MGASLSCSARSPDIGSEASPGLLPLTDLMGQHYSFENLIFEGCGVKGYAYAGALKVFPTHIFDISSAKKKMQLSLF